MIPPGGRLQGDGSITFPMRGDPPPCNLPGYRVDPDDPFRWLMIYCKCQHRKLAHQWICSNGKMRTGDYCQVKNLPINPLYCNQDCTIEDKIKTSLPLIDPT